MMEMIEALWWLPRDLISEGYDAALAALDAQLPMTIHEYPTGSECWTWIMPPKWICREAFVETVGGKRLFSYADHPLHVASYSLPFEGLVSREELFAHLEIHSKIPKAIPWAWRFYEREWALCCSALQKQSLTDDRYRVVIDAEDGPGTLKVGEVVAGGRSEECIMLCAHLDHPAMANDDLSGVVVGMEVMRRLLRRKGLRYTYRFLILPETIGSVAYLSHHESLIPLMKGGLFLEMLGLDHPFALQRSHAGQTSLDRCFARVLKARAPQGWVSGFRTIINNDERQFNAPGVRVPMLSLSRCLRQSDRDWPYREYHSSFDTPRLASARRLEESVELVLAMVGAWEATKIPRNRFAGEVFMSRYQLHVDFYKDRAGHKRLFDIMYELDGTKSVEEIAERLSVPAARVLDVARSLERHGLIEWA